jgi:hypothetical protein
MRQDRTVQDRKHGRDEDLWGQGRPQAEGQEAQAAGLTGRWFFCGLAFIAITSILDASLVVAFGTLDCEEMNPAGSLLIREFGTWGLFTAKMAGTVLVVAVLLFLFKKWRPAAHLITAVVAAFQLLLMIFIFS